MPYWKEREQTLTENYACQRQVEGRHESLAEIEDRHGLPRFYQVGDKDIRIERHICKHCLLVFAKVFEGEWK